jgi:hypothetical protein
VAFVRIDQPSTPDVYVDLDHVVRITPNSSGDVTLTSVDGGAVTLSTGSQAAGEQYALDVAEAAGLVTVD